MTSPINALMNRPRRRPLSHWMRMLATVTHLLLIVAMLAQFGFSRASLLAAPLLLPLPGILRGRLYTYRWASMLLAFYSALYLAAGYHDPGTQTISFAIATLAALDFVGLVLFVRFSAREQPRPGTST